MPGKTALLRAFRTRCSASPVRTYSQEDVQRTGQTDVAQCTADARSVDHGSPLNSRFGRTPPAPSDSPMPINAPWASYRRTRPAVPHSPANTGWPCKIFAVAVESSLTAAICCNGASAGRIRGCRLPQWRWQSTPMSPLVRYRTVRRRPDVVPVRARRCPAPWRYPLPASEHKCPSSTGLPGPGDQPTDAPCIRSLKISISRAARSTSIPALASL